MLLALAPLALASSLSVSSLIEASITLALGILFERSDAMLEDVSSNFCCCIEWCRYCSFWLRMLNSIGDWRIAEEGRGRQRMHNNIFGTWTGFSRFVDLRWCWFFTAWYSTKNPLMEFIWRVVNREGGDHILTYLCLKFVGWRQASAQRPWNNANVFGWQVTERIGSRVGVAGCWWDKTIWMGGGSCWSPWSPAGLI